MRADYFMLFLYLCHQFVTSLMYLYKILVTLVLLVASNLVHAQREQGFFVEFIMIAVSMIKQSGEEELELLSQIPIHKIFLCLHQKVQEDGVSP